MTDPDSIVRTILTLTARRGPGRTVCPSEVARALGGHDWRPMMPAVREAARALAAGGLITVTQSGRTLAPDGRWKGPIRLARSTAPDERDDA